MSKKTVYTLISTGTFVVIASTSIVTFAQGGMMKNENLQSAIRSGDYSTFMETVKTENPEKADEILARIDEEEFAVIQERIAAKELIDSAIENEDWAAYQTSTADLPLDSEHGKKKVTIAQTEDEFKQLVLKHQLRETIKTAIDEKDWESFSAASQSMQELKSNTDGDKRRGPKTPTSEEEFNEMIAKMESGEFKPNEGGRGGKGMDRQEGKDGMSKPERM
jgi:GGDEF domain-containing protein